MDRSGASVSIEGVRRRFNEASWVIEKLDLKIGSGEFVSLLGPSGCGKSTLLRMIAGLDGPDEGRIAIDSFGRSFFKGFVFQDAHLLPWRSVLANVALPLQLMGEARRDSEEKARSALVKVGLADALAKRPAELSGGMRMRVSLARALVVEPSLLLLDEPFAALDENTRHRLQEDLRALWEAGRTTVVFVTHSVTEAVFLSSRAVVLSKRPAKILLDHRVELPDPRPARVRTSSAFVTEMDRIYEAFKYEEEAT